MAKRLLVIFFVLLASVCSAYAQSCDFDVTISPNSISAASDDDFKFTLRTSGDPVDKAYGIKLISYPGSSGIIDFTEMLNGLGISVGQWVLNDTELMRQLR